MTTDKPPRKTALARKMRKALTQPEWLLWERLKDRDASGLIFRRQHTFGPYILDFYCAKAKLCVEVDGALHGFGDQPERDAIRDQRLKAQGIETYRLSAHAIMRDPDDAADGVILLAIERVERP